MDGSHPFINEVNGINFQVMPRQFAFNNDFSSLKKPFQCAICNATFEETTSLKLHFSAVHQRGPSIPVDVLLNQKPSIVQQKSTTDAKRQIHFQNLSRFFCSYIFQLQFF